ncbi:MAG: glycoside hydrolase family 2 protein [Caldilineaceae bacterium]
MRSSHQPRPPDSPQAPGSVHTAHRDRRHRAGRRAFRRHLRTDKPALWCWLQLGDHDATYSDNFVHLRPGASREIIVSPAQAMTADAFTSALTVSSLRDTYA